MRQHLTDAYSFKTGLVRDAKKGYILGVKDKNAEDLPHTVLFVWDNGKWGSKLISWTCRSMALRNSQDPTLYVLGETGRILVGTASGFSEEVIENATHSGQYQDLRDIRCIGKGIYACGMMGSVFRRGAKATWEPLSLGLPQDGDDSADLESIDGFDEKEVYAVGWDGGMWYYNGKSWHRIDSLTNLLINKVLCADDGVVYACGQSGLLMKGRGDKWEIIIAEETDGDFWSLCRFQGKIYASTSRFVYVLDSSAKLELVKFDDDIPKTCYHLSVAQDVMWSIGPKDVMSFDGDTWTRIE
jgi:hypothetical protein